MQEFDSNMPTQNPSSCCRNSSQSTPLAIASPNRSDTGGVRIGVASVFDLYIRQMFGMSRSLVLGITSPFFLNSDRGGFCQARPWMTLGQRPAQKDLGHYRQNLLVQIFTFRHSFIETDI